ncbi:hypothetical protein, partial [Prevotella sp.]|uniref:hypothetical protein n=1 Tax=Prevotella sp. TaxID=59823 RepID=UPI00307F7E6F
RLHTAFIALAVANIVTFSKRLGNLLFPTGLSELSDKQDRHQKQAFMRLNLNTFYYLKIIKKQ